MRNRKNQDYSPDKDYEPLMCKECGTEFNKLDDGYCEQCLEESVPLWKARAEAAERELPIVREQYEREKRELAELRGKLKELEWCVLEQYADVGCLCCPVCGQYKPRVFHAYDCWLADAIKKGEGGGK